MAETVPTSGARSVWGWRAPSRAGVWKHGPAWARPFVAAAPWLSLALALGFFALIEGRVVGETGTLVDLPETALGEAAVPALTAVVLPSPNDDGTLVFFDDARYLLADAASLESLRRHVAERLAAGAEASLLLLADQRVPTGETMRFVDAVRAAGVKRVHVAEKRN